MNYLDIAKRVEADLSRKAEKSRKTYPVFDPSRVPAEVWDRLGIDPAEYAELLELPDAVYMRRDNLIRVIPWSFFETAGYRRTKS